MTTNISRQIIRPSWFKINFFVSANELGLSQMRTCLVLSVEKNVRLFSGLDPQGPRVLKSEVGLGLISDEVWFSGN